MRFLLCMLLIFSLQGKAQKKELTNRPLFNLTLTIDHISFPGNNKYRPRHTVYTEHDQPRNWGIAAGIDLPYTKNSNKQIQAYQRFNVGFLVNAGMQHSFRVYTEPFLLYKLTRQNSFHFQTGLQLGYMRSYPTNGMIRKEPGKTYINHKGRGQFTAGLMMGTGHSILSEQIQMKNSFQYHFWLQGPFIPKLAPLLPHQSYSFTTSFNF